MLRVDAFSHLSLTKPSIATVGMFDGLHRGHQRILKPLVTEAHASGKLAAVVSFFPHPDVVLRGVEGRYYLTPPYEKERLLREWGVDVWVMHPFNTTVREMRAAAFVDQMLASLNMVELWASPEFAMGYKREGNIDFLRAQGAEKGFAIRTVELLGEDGKRVSSTRIRNALEQGNISEANHLLGRPYRLAGEVVHGDQRGRSIGFPTANVAVWQQQILPQKGVYVCKTRLGDEVFNAVTNVGYRPTFDGTTVTVEAHIFDFERDLYGQTLAIEFLQRLRGERKFDGIEDLVAQIRQDAAQARSILGVQS